MTNLARAKLLALGLITGVLAGAAPAFSGEEAPTRMVYRVQHSKYGDVGSYTNVVEKNADTTTVTTQGRMKVSILGVSAYRQEFDRIERWMGSRLVNFHGVTTVNGKRTEVNGAVEGDHFTLITPIGMVTARST